MTSNNLPAPPSGTARGPNPGPVGPGAVGLGHQLGIFAFDIGAPIACYYLLRAAGFSSLVALAAGAVLPALAAAYQLATRRRVDPIAVMVIATMALSVLMAALTNSSQLLLAREGLLTGLWGMVFVASVGARRPMAFSIARPLMDGRRVFAALSWDDLWADEPAFRRIWRVSTLVWGGALLADAVIRVLMVFWLPVGQVVWLGGLLWPVTLVVINVATNLYYRRTGLFRLLGARWLRDSQ